MKTHTTSPLHTIAYDTCDHELKFPGKGSNSHLTSILAYFVLMVMSSELKEDVLLSAYMV